MKRSNHNVLLKINKENSLLYNKASRRGIRIENDNIDDYTNIIYNIPNIDNERCNRRILSKLMFNGMILVDNKSEDETNIRICDNIFYWVKLEENSITSNVDEDIYNFINKYKKIYNIINVINNNEFYEKVDKSQVIPYNPYLYEETWKVNDNINDYKDLDVYVLIEKVKLNDMDLYMSSKKIVIPIKEWMKI